MMKIIHLLPIITPHNSNDCIDYQSFEAIFVFKLFIDASRT